MSAQGTLPAARARAVRTVAALVWITVLAGACSNASAPRLMVSHSPGASHAAVVELTPCGQTWCEVLLAGKSAADLRQLATLAAGEHCTEIAWTRDGSRVAFLIDGYQLRLYNTDSNAPAGQLDLVARDGDDARVARGVTFSGNGAAITFDDCPRARSGCRPGMAALR